MLKSTEDRRVARSMLTGAVLLIAQLGAYKIRELVGTGQENDLNRVTPRTRGTVAQFQEALREASPISILKSVK